MELILCVAVAQAIEGGGINLGVFRAERTARVVLWRLRTPPDFCYLNATRLATQRSQRRD